MSLQKNTHTQTKTITTNTDTHRHTRVRVNKRTRTLLSPQFKQSSQNCPFLWVPFLGVGLTRSDRDTYHCEESPEHLQSLCHGSNQQRQTTRIQRENSGPNPAVKLVHTTQNLRISGSIPFQPHPGGWMFLVVFEGGGVLPFGHGGGCLPFEHCFKADKTAPSPMASLGSISHEATISASGLARLKLEPCSVSGKKAEVPSAPKTSWFHCFQQSWKLSVGKLLLSSHLLTGLAKTSPNFSFATKMVFSKSDQTARTQEVSLEKGFSRSKKNAGQRAVF